MMESSKFKDREAALLRELSALYTKLNQVRDKRVKEEKTYGVGGSNSRNTDETGVKDLKRRRRVLLVTRTLPFWLVSENAQSQWRAEFPEHASLNGAIEIFQSLHESYDCIWIGSVHGEIEPSEQNTLKEQLLQDRKYYPVFLDERRERLYYQGFCKTVMWPLFHSCPPTTDDQIIQHEMMEDGQEDDRSMEKMWQAYVAVNQAFADAVQEIYEEGDMVWIQGYHLTLVPQMVQNLFPNDNICMGFFMHIPFPSAELYRILNNREEILTGILGADLIGFQTYEYARHFQNACVRLLGLESSHKGVDYNGHLARVTICPVGLDANKYTAMVQSDAVQEQIKQLTSQFAGKKVILGMDQLDQTKGLVHKLLAVEELFTQKPDLAKKVVFLQIVTSPSVFEAALESQVESLVSRINSKLQDIGTEGPVQYLNKDLAVEALLALYALADTLVITPVRDGMNTIPFGYIVCREAANKHARVILSEFAGCAQSLSKARLVNPWNTEELTVALLESLQENDEVMRAHQHMFSYVSSFTSRHWADNFLEQLHACREENAVSVSGRELSRRDMTSAYSRSSRRLILINYEGVLAVEASIPELAYPPQELIWQLSMLTNDPRNTVVLVSARSTSMCEQWFAGLSGNLVLAAEYGVYVKWVGENESWHCLVPDMDMSWWEHIVPLLEYYTERTPGAYIERKNSSVAWHYRDCDMDHGLWQASELLVSLREITRSLPVSVYPGNRYLEVRPKKVSKATLFERIWKYMNWSLLFPDEDPVTTNFLGEPVHSLSAPNTTFRGYQNEMCGDNDQLPTPRLDDIDLQFPQKNIFMQITTESESLSIDQLSDADEKHPVDFVLVIASGDDRTDEDLFAFLVPPPIDLDAYSRHDMSDTEQQRKKILPLDPVSDETSFLFDRQQQAEFIKNGASSSSFNDISDDMSYNTSRRLRKQGSDSTPHAAGLFGKQEGLSTASPLARLSSLPNDVNLRALGDNMTKLSPFTNSPIAEKTRNMFPVPSQPFVARKDDISEQSKLTRRDFPPSAALFEAMKAKYGENFGLHRIPDTLAACWALVCPPPAPGKTDDGTKSQSKSCQSLLKEKIPISEKCLTIDGLEALTMDDLKEGSVVKNGLATIQPTVICDNEDGSSDGVLRSDEDHTIDDKLDSNIVQLHEEKETNESDLPANQATSVSTDEVDDGRYRFPVNTFVCTLGRKHSQAPYYIKNSGDLFQLLQEMGMSSHIRKQRVLSMSSVGDI